MSPNEYADHFGTLVDLYVASGNVLSEADKTAFLVEARLRGHSKLSRRTLRPPIMKASPSPGWSAYHAPALTTTSRSPCMDLTLTLTFHVTSRPTSPPRMSLAPPVKERPLRCDCWSKEICEKCGKKGHIGSVCRVTGTAAKGPAPKPDSRSSKAQQK
eukprot:gene46400-57857_t